MKKSEKYPNPPCGENQIMYQELPRPKDAVIDDFMDNLGNYIFLLVLRSGAHEAAQAKEKLRQSLEELIS